MITFAVSAFLSYTAFSSQVGLLYWIPRTFWIVRIFPTRLIFFDVSNTEEKEISTLILEFSHAIDSFRVECQWDRERLLVILQTGKTVSVFALQRDKDPFSCALCLLRGSFLHVTSLEGEEVGKLVRGEWIRLSLYQAPCPCSTPLPASSFVKIPKLSFGSSKKKCLDSFDQRTNPQELLPCLYALSCLLPHELEEGGIVCSASEQNILSVDFVSVWRHHFSRTGVPSWKDQRFYGTKPFFSGKGSPLKILFYFGRAILRSLVRVENGQLVLSPVLPSWFVSGRLRDLPCSFGFCSLMWSRRRLRRCVLTVMQDFVCNLVFPPGVKGFRSTRKGGGPGMCHVIGSELVTFAFQAGDVYCFDRFEH
ncbi:hypothetical protein [Candidatus Similichlamydia laticola]|uniref:Uncharacterized protein n=1 Tax=Candidatus Similichlamydia laticola TaxID=2170265 RepID=A0A369KAJ8_9BACT|nr:hypothetical protein [Candidatus Similichlamydia laticola]RDB31629.1 hypothetical protein HAT2_00240 [Candidatus Similichlamydia laticola]